MFFYFQKKMFKCMHHIPEVNRNCSCKTFWSNFLVLLFERACCSYVPLHFTIRQWYGKSSFSVYSLGQIQKVLCTDNTLGLEDNTESIYFFINLFCDNIGETGPPLVNFTTMHRRVVCKDQKIQFFNAKITAEL